MKENIWQRYIEIEKDTSLASLYASDKWYTLKDPITSEWIAYSGFLEEHASELSNTINDFRRYIKSLSVWKIVIKDLDEQEHNNVVVEHIAPLATLALNMPYVIRSRFIYSIAHLSHQANRYQEKNWQDNLPIDKEIYFETADIYSNTWKRYKKLKTSLERIANKKYGIDTHDFRNKYNHRYSPRIEVGLSEFVVRNVKYVENGNDQVSYAFGYQDPLMLEDIIPVLTTQLNQCLNSYEKYQALINEQLEKNELI